jgi:MinD superfamily P-loop ATPase
MSLRLNTKGTNVIAVKGVQICRFRAIAIAGDMVLTIPELYHRCGGCMVVCSQGPIIATGREWDLLDSGAGCGTHFTHGRPWAGEAMAPPLIRVVCKHSWDHGLKVIDAPPGTSCR